MLLTILVLLAGITFLFLGGHYLVTNAVFVAKSLNVSNLIIGVTVVSIGTSAPEAVISIQAALSGHPDIVIGNIIGSNISNMLVVIPAAAMILPIMIDVRLIKNETCIMLLSTILFYIMCVTGKITRLDGMILFAGFILFNVYAFKFSTNDEVLEKEIDEDVVDIAPKIINDSSMRNFLFNNFVVRLFCLILSILMLLYGSHLFVKAAVEISNLLGVSEGVIGLTVVALGSSSPEIFASFMAARHGHPDLVIGNVLGSNVFNILGITGLTALITDIPVDQVFVNLDLVILLAVAALLIIYMFYVRKIYRLFSCLSLTLYLAYVYYLFAFCNACLNL